MIRFLVGLLLAVGTVVGALLLEGGNGFTLLGLSAFTMVWFVPFFLSAAVWGYRAWVDAWKAAFRPVEIASARRSAKLWGFNEFAFYASGLLGCLAGLILILGYDGWDSASAPQIGRSLAAALIAPLYGFFFGYMAKILKARVETINV